jgi:hypothetical protein
MDYTVFSTTADVPMVMVNPVHDVQVPRGRVARNIPQF